MRNVYIVLVPLCFGLTSGFIVPSGVQEILTDLQDNSNPISSSASKTRSLLHMESKNNSQIHNITNVNKSMTLEKTNDSLHTDLYEHSQPKDADVKERSFIYINQRARKPLRNRFYDNPSQRDHVKGNTHRSYLLNINNIFEELPRQFSIGYIGEKNVEISEKPDHRCHSKLRNEIKQNCDWKSEQQTDKQASTEQREYVKQLKAPLLRAEAKHNDARIDGMGNNLLSYIQPSLQKSKNGYILLNPPEIQNINVSVNRNFVDSGPLNNLKKIADDKGFTIDTFGKKIDDNIVYNKKLKLDKFKQRRKGKQSNENKHHRESSSNFNQNILNFCRNCMNEAKKHKLSSRLHLEKICKCGHNEFLRNLEQMKQ